jgi:membrane protein YqaA with SNARE-associated domain
MHSVVFFPAEIVNATAGLAFGFWVAFPIVLVSLVLSGLIAYWLGRVAGRPLAVRLAGELLWVAIGVIVVLAALTVSSARRLRRSAG